MQCKFDESAGAIAKSNNRPAFDFSFFEKCSRRVKHRERQEQSYCIFDTDFAAFVDAEIGRLRVTRFLVLYWQFFVSRAVAPRPNLFGALSIPRPAVFKRRCDRCSSVAPLQSVVSRGA